MSLRPFRWNANALRYYGPDGRFVARRQVRSAIDRALENAGREMRAVTQALRAKELTITQWKLVMRREIKNVHLYSAASARGGWAELTQSQLGQVGKIVGEQYRYLDNFARQLSSGKVRRDGKILGRAEMYAQAGRRTYHAIDERLHEARGYEEERNMLGAGDNCAECIAEEAQGWVPIGSLVPVGMRTCLSRCNCSVEYRKGDTE